MQGRSTVINLDGEKDSYSTRRIYLKMLLYQCLIGAIFGAISDIAAQLCIEQTTLTRYNTKKTMKIFLYQFIYATPIVYNWYLYLDYIFTNRSVFSPLLKMSCDQLLMSPILNASFLAYMSYTRYWNWQTTQMVVVQQYGKVMKFNYLLWPLAQLINFYLIHISYRIMFVGIVGIVWGTFMAWTVR
ncbi:hypothetical protein SNEBB_000644 [Seison nebaliae]|nr:hypothetical protein SNEBB_000644 [Seison nebaliae]